MLRDLFIMPLQRERTWSLRGGSGVCHRMLQREMGHHKKGEVIRQRVLLQEEERDDNIHENRTQYRLHTNSGHSTSLITLSNCCLSLI